MANKDIQKMLEQRLGASCWRQRLEIEKEVQVSGQGIGFVSIENLALSSSVLIRAVLMATGLDWRGILQCGKGIRDTAQLHRIAASAEGFRRAHHRSAQ